MPLSKQKQLHLVPPSINFTEHSYTRIEIGFSFCPDHLPAIRSLIKHYSSSEELTIVTRARRAHLWSRKESVEAYFERHCLEKNETHEFFESIKSNQENIKSTDLISDLTVQQQKLIHFCTQSKKEKRLVMSTAGFYLSALCAGYSLIQSFLDKGGILLEITYPHFTEDRPLNSPVCNNVIRLGEMKL